jgi:hypothetical protein
MLREDLPFRTEELIFLEKWHSTREVSIAVPTDLTSLMIYFKDLSHLTHPSQATGKGVLRSTPLPLLPQEPGALP